VAAAVAGIQLLDGDLRKVAAALDIARATRRVIWQNLGWAFGCNLLAIPAAALGYLSPVIAGGAMALSSVLVVSNALRLKNWSPQLALAKGQP
jgi:Cu+-exporting ATPase